MTYRIHTEGNGAFVTITHISTGRDVFLQGDDAAQFLELLANTNDLYTDDDLCDEYAGVLSDPLEN